MTHHTNHAPRAMALPAVALVGGLTLAGCSSGNIGESWQCPLAEGGSCASVAAADPAVPDAGGRTVLGEPLWQVRGNAPEAPMQTACEADCGRGFDPFGWLARLFGDPASRIDVRDRSSAGAGGNDVPGEQIAGGQQEPATAGKTETLPGGPGREADAAASSAAPDAAKPQLAEAAAAGLPAEQSTVRAEPAAAEDGPQADDLRTGEVVARIWIAPFVDAGGVYREASYIRVVLEPAGWRLK